MKKKKEKLTVISHEDCHCVCVKLKTEALDLGRISNI